MNNRAALMAVNAAIEHLRQARELLKQAGCPKATEKVRSSLRSAEGARRNVSNRPYREMR